MKTIYKIIIAVLGFVLFIVVGIYSGLIGGGSYEYAQQYDFNTSKDNLIGAIKEFKDQNPQYKVPVNLDIVDSPGSTNDYYHVYVYYPLDNEIIHFVILNNLDNPNKSSLYLDAVNKGKYLGHWRVVNRDYDRNENLEVKKVFEERLLAKLKLPYKDTGNGMFIFWK